MNLKIKIGILIYLMFLVSCTTLKESPHSIVGDVIDDVLNNPQKLYNLYEFYPELRCDASIYDLTKDSVKLIEVINNIYILKNDTSYFEIGHVLDDSSNKIYTYKKYFNANYIKEKDEGIQIRLLKQNSGVNFIFLFKDRKYYLYNIFPFCINCVDM